LAKNISVTYAQVVDHDPTTDSDRLRQGGNPLLHASDCVENADSQTAICYSWRSDNSGPHTYPEALQIFGDAQRIYPKANVTSIDAFYEFVRAVEPHKAKLALVTAEIGDTWIQGASSDPLKVALFRSASRQRAKCIATDSCEPASDSLSFKNFERLLMKVGEHTWGWNGGDTRAGGWSNAEFAAERKTDAQYSTVVKTWQEQRAFILNAVAALPAGSSLRDAISAEWEQLRPMVFNGTGFERVSASSYFSCGAVLIAFDAATGGIRSLRGPGGTNWASSKAQLAQVWYQNEDVNYTHLPALDSKPGLNLSALNSNARITDLRRKVGVAETTFKLTMTMTDNDVHAVRGAPALLEALVQVPHASQNNVTGGSAAIEISYTLQWFNKTATKAPETIWLRNTPAATQDATAWRIHKLGAMVNPLDADLSVGAGKHCDPMHADGRSVSAQRPSPALLSVPAQLTILSGCSEVSPRGGLLIGPRVHCIARRARRVASTCTRSTPGLSTAAARASWRSRVWTRCSSAWGIRCPRQRHSSSPIRSAACTSAWWPTHGTVSDADIAAPFRRMLLLL
jgi:hypothetical protein